MLQLKFKLGTKWIHIRATSQNIQRDFSDITSNGDRILILQR